MFEFHIFTDIRKKYRIDESFFSTNGNVIFANFHAVRLFVYKINQLRKPDLHVYPGEVNAAGLIEEIYHIVLRQYEAQLNPEVFAKAQRFLEKELGKPKLFGLMADFVGNFPPTVVFQGKVTAEDYLKETTNDRSNLLITIEELMMLWFANFNPGNKKLKELFDENHLSDVDAFHLFSEKLEAFFINEPPFGPDQQDIFTLFKTPILKNPNNLSAQLDFILEHWKHILPESLVVQLLKGKDLFREDVTFGAGGGPPPAVAPVYKGFGGDGDGFTIGKSGYQFIKDAAADYEEPEHFTDDVHWMPRVVLLAKNTYVWLDQLSKKYDREIRRLDQIPDEELDQLVKWNFTGLWLIGIWERSEASRRIKHIMGNIDAVSSAYSLFDYEIAHDLGGEAAYQNLNTRAKARGIRLASDMVPNHTGLFSKWTLEYPDYFIQTDTPPFPGYTFSGENLSQHPDFEIRIEDGYYSKTDAAVVFQWIDKRNGQTRYIYHGNDGTSMPWNDTAQLDMLKQAVREAVIQKIFDVARRFSIIRFDAAMTLAKKHFSRLWYPRPGTGGDIPSRADYAMTKEEFDEHFPVEFWREVVDRMNENMPETLLLAEAFWFMEGYFVRTLGMHRVYNSAFMHMLKNEENEKYRDLITNTLEFEPEILKRYVNFMSNPDEETAIRQFGTGDKYFGVCVLMNTLPGLPMFSHGQTEGFSEKYGMEYQRAYYNETPQQWLVEKHEREIFPLTRKRYLFSEVLNFNIFDYTDGSGNVNENVFAYTNRYMNDRTLVLFNNKYEQAFGVIKISAPKLIQGGDDKETATVSISDVLGVNLEDDIFYIFKEHVSGLEYLRSAQELHDHGFRWNLNGFEYRVFWNFREVQDTRGDYRRLHQQLNGAGVSDIWRAMKEIRLQPVHQTFESLFSDQLINELSDFISKDRIEDNWLINIDGVKQDFEMLISRIAVEYELADHHHAVTSAFIHDLKSIESAFRYFYKNNQLLTNQLAAPGSQPLAKILTIHNTKSYRESLIILLAYFVLKNLRPLSPDPDDQDGFLAQLKLEWPLQNLFKMTGAGQPEIIRNINLINILVTYGHELFDFNRPAIHQSESDSKRKLTQKVNLAVKMANDEFVQNLIGVNIYKEVAYFSKEQYEELSDWIFTLAVLNYFTEKNIPEDHLPDILKQTLDFWYSTRLLSENSGYRMKALRENLKKVLDEAE